MQPKTCGHKGAEGSHAEDDLKTHIQFTVSLHCKAAYVAAGYNIVAEDEHMITVRNKIYKKLK